MAQVQQQEALANLSKEELIARIIDLDKRNTEIMGAKKSALINGRPAQVLQLLKDNQAIAIADMAKKLNVSSRDISTNLTTLKKAGYCIHTDDQGRKYLVIAKQKESNDEQA